MDWFLKISKQMEKTCASSSHISLQCLVLYFIPFITNINATIRQETLASRVIQFGDVKAGKYKYLKGSSVIILFEFTVQRCALECSRTLTCRSFNFHGRQTCELNMNDIFSIGVVAAHLRGMRPTLTVKKDTLMLRRNSNTILFLLNFHYNYIMYF